MSTGEDVLDQLIGDQTGVVVALAIIVATNSTSRSQQVIGELAQDGGTQHEFPRSIEGAGAVFLQYGWRWCYQYQTLKELGVTVSISDHKGYAEAMSYRD